MHVQFVFDRLLAELAPAKDSEVTGAYELRFGEGDFCDLDIADIKDTDLFPDFLIDLFHSYCFACGDWPADAETLMKWLEEDAGRRLFQPEEDREIVVEKLRQLFDLQNQVRSLYIANLPEMNYFRYECSLAEVLYIFKNMQSVQVCENEEGFFSKDGILYQNASDGTVDDPEYYKTVVFCPPDCPLTELSLDASVKAICEEAFMGNKNLVHIETEAQAIRIDYLAFLNARSLETVRLSGVRVEIVSHAFRHCSALKQFVIPRGSIASCDCFAFDPESAVYREILTEWIHDSGYTGNPDEVAVFGRCGDTAWRYVDKDNTEHVIGNGKMWDYKPFPAWERSPYFQGNDLIIHDGITAIGANAFLEQGFFMISFAGSVREVRDCAFAGGGCGTVTFPGTIRHLGGYLFYSDPCGVEEIIISSEIEQIDACAFLWRIDGPDKVTFTGENPPADWIMWMRSELFDEKDTVVYFPEKWRGVMTHEYFEIVRESIRAAGLPEKKESLFDYDVEERIAFIDEMEKYICRGAEAGESDEEEKPRWAAYE